MFGKIWSFFTGKKTPLGMGLVLIAQGGRLIVPEGEVVWGTIEKIGLGLGGVGLGHKAVR